MTNIMNIYIYIIYIYNIYIYSRMAAWLTRWFAFWLITRGHSKSIKRRRWYHPLSHRQYRHSPAQGIKMNPDESNWIKLGRMLCIWECGVHGVHTQPLQTLSASADPFSLNILSFTLRHTDAFTFPGSGEQHDTAINTVPWRRKDEHKLVASQVSICTSSWSHTAVLDEVDRRWSKDIKGIDKIWQVPKYPGQLQASHNVSPAFFPTVFGIIEFLTACRLT